MLAKSGKFLRVVFALFALAFAFSPGGARAATNQLLLLVPDTLTLPDPRVSAWLDSAQEEGLQIQVITDSQFMQAGAALSQYPGLILPDQVHTVADDTLVTAIQNYALNGGKVMLVYDFGVLNSAGFYPIPKSRFSSMVGVDYVLYDQLGGNMIGLGNVTGMSSWLRTIQVPPGKSMPWTTTSVATTTSALLTAATGTTSTAPSSTVMYLSASPSNPGGLKNYNHSAWFGYTLPKGGKGKFTSTSPKLRGFVTGKPVKSGTYSASSLTTTSTTSTTTTAKTNTLLATTSAQTDTLEGISGYVYGFLTYPSFVTQGTYTGTTILTSPSFGLVSGYNVYGNGGVLFVNLPLAYLDGQTDGMLIHGFLHYFGTNLLKLPSLSNLPKAKGGLVFQWHFCAEDQIQPALYLKSLGVWNNGPFTMAVTAGPDEATFGDGDGINLDNNPTAINLMKYFISKGDHVGSQGGWIHDYWGFYASETNQSTFQQYLVLNHQAVTTATGRPDTEYASPEGNAPTWAITWLESNGFNGYYFTGHTGSEPTRAYRNGALLNPGLWAYPVMPFGKYATFEEFQLYSVPTTDVINWYTSLINFVASNRTSRLIYAHPLGASSYTDVLTSIFTQANALKQLGQFTWYTMTDITNFNRSRLNVTWSATDMGSSWAFAASHPTSLANMTWLLPKAAYAQPVVTLGSATVVGTDATNWLVIANGGTSLKFTSAKVQ
ncbi:membrane protein [Burkholderia thailandensis]|uniref:membrane protein n=1 Tax=Burkholderia thailandensis TaxID=57975 RepID=UPI00016A75C9|nr:membrane protein [Burkholderia thailandensis]AHI80949.1 putative outer membrane protein [Burkholderia thailandensis E444]AIC90776.1 putative outer membrane protein [Burkholderia thailandensis USAMRU Malaysia \